MLLIFFFLLTLVHEISIWTILTHSLDPFFGLVTSPWGVKTLKFWDSVFQKRIHTSPQIFLSFFTFTLIYFHLSITTGTWNTSLGCFWSNFGLMTSPTEPELQYFDKVISETNFSLPISIKSWFHSFYHPRTMIYNFGPFLPNLEKMTSQKKSIF